MSGTTAVGVGRAGLEFEKLETLLVDGEFTLSRGTWGPGRTPALLLSPTFERPSPATLARLEHKFSLRDEVAAEWAVRPLALVRPDGLATLVLEDPGGELLVQRTGRPWETSSFLRVAIELAAALGLLHARGIVHRDIKPANVVVDVLKGKVWLSGFGIASRLPRERRPAEPPEVIAGTLAYMAPEQTGRMNRSVDSRSDLYSYGITLYEMLTGTLPFDAQDPMGWVHSHIAKQPRPVRERAPGTPAQVEAIVEKLMAKSAEARYQTAAGVEADLRTCLASWEAEGQIHAFPLGEGDISDKLLIPENLYGRESDIATLLDAFDRVVATGCLELVLVSGYSGIGKSSVVNELQKPLVPPRGLFAMGKFDQYKRDIPYATLAQALQGVVRMILAGSESDIARWRDAILSALGAHGQLVVDLIPELEIVIGPQPPVPELPPQDAQVRFQMVIQRFLEAFASAEHPLALFLDDLQWLDPATLKLLESLVTRRELQHILLVGAYRDNEVDASHPLSRSLEAIRSSGARLSELRLGPLSLHDIGQLLQDALRLDTDEVAPLASLVHEKTGGNPFFAIQFVAALADDRLISFCNTQRRWTWDLERIRAKGFTDNVVDLLLGKLGRLSDAARRALSHFAAFGNVADARVLALVHGDAEGEVDAALWEAIRAGLVLRSHDEYSFLHDRVQEAAYKLIPLEQRAAEHLRIGRLLASPRGPSDFVTDVFEIVNQLNRGIALIESTAEREQVAELNLRAGRRAKASSAYASALEYFTVGSQLVDHGWAHQHRLAWELTYQRASCEILCARLDAAAQHIAELKERAASKAETAAVSILIIELHVMRSENDKAVAAGVECLRLFGIEMTAHPPRTDLDALYDDVWRKLDGRRIESLVELPRLSDPDIEAAMQVLAVLNAPAIFTDEILAGLDILHMVRLTLEYGVSPASSYALGYFGIILGHYYHRYDDGYRFGALAREVVKRHEFTAFETKTLFTLELVSIWSQPLTAAVDAVRAAFFTGVESGDLTITCFANSHIGSEMLARGDRLDDVWNETTRSLAFAEKAQFRDVAMLILGTQRFIETMRGRTFSLESFDGEGFDEAAFEEELSAPGRMSTMVCWHWLIKAQARFICGDVDQAERALERSRELFWSSAPGHVQNIDYHFFSALTLAALEARGPRQELRQERLEIHRAQLERWRDSSPSTFSGKCALVAAEVARAEARDVDAIRLYDKAVQASRRYGFLQDEALANELAAHFYAACGAETIARACAREARHAYFRWGALGKVRQLEQLDPHLREEPAPGPRSTIGAPVEDLDWGTVVKLSQALSSEILLDKWMTVLMTLSLEHAGAGWGALLVPRGGELQVVAEAASAPLGIEVCLHPARAAAELPESLFRYVSRTRERVLLDDASSSNPFAADAYFVREACRSVLCLPLVKQGELIGILYLENNLSPRIFTPGRSALLELVASHAAVSLDHAQLFAQLEQRLAFERLISDLSAEIGESPLDALDVRISASLERLSRFLGIERAIFFEFTPENNELRTAAFWCSPGQLPPPSTIDAARVPVTVDHLRRSEPFCCETPADLPASDRWVLDRVGMQSFAGLPASVEGVGLGYLFLGAVNKPRRWPDDMVQRLRVVADILANALARKHAERDRRIQRELAQALEFRELVMGILGHYLRSPLGAASGLVQLVLRHEGLPEVLSDRREPVDGSNERPHRDPPRFHREPLQGGRDD